jgi:hypothetical protein
MRGERMGLPQPIHSHGASRERLERIRQMIELIGAVGRLFTGRSHNNASTSIRH